MICEGFLLAQTPYQKYPSISNAPYSVFDKYAYQENTIKDVIKLTAEHQLKRYGENIPTKDWLVGTFYSSFVAAYNVTSDEWYLSQAYDWGKKSEWNINLYVNADDVCPAQTYLDLYLIKNDESLYATVHDKLKILFDRDSILPFEKNDFQRKSLPLDGRNTWSWCDALYMAPPVYARMGKVTGDSRYFEMLHRLYWDSVDFLYSKKYQLFYRNSKEQTEKLSSPNGKKVFWSRGNGWVIAGLARLIEFLPDNDLMKEKYIALFQDLAFSIAKYQMEDGLWRSSLNDPEWITSKETSGSSFFVYAFAKGINEGWLPREYFAPAVLKGWSGLLSCVTPEGKLGYSQIVAGSPHEVRPYDSKDYAVGAFILAGTEMLKFSAADLFAEQSTKAFMPRLVATDAALSANGNVIYNNNVFFASYIKNSDESAFMAYSVEKWSSCHAQKEKILSPSGSVPFLLALNDGKILASYTNPFLSQRKITVPRWNECRLDAEIKIGEKANNAFSCSLSDEDNLILQFYLDENYNLKYIASDDNAETWCAPLSIIKLNEKSTVKYVSNGIDRVDIAYVYKNFIYHIYYKNGAFYNSKAKRIVTQKTLEKQDMISVKTNAITVDKFEVLFDLEYDRNNNLRLALGAENKVYIAKLEDEKWETKELGFVGEFNDFTNATLYPNNDTIVISVNVNPENGKLLPKAKYQLFKGIKDGNTWNWEQLTFDPVFNHYCPTVVNGEIKALFWNTGNKLCQSDVMMSYEF